MLFKFLSSEGKMNKWHFQTYFHIYFHCYYLKNAVPLFIECFSFIVSNVLLISILKRKLKKQNNSTSSLRICLVILVLTCFIQKNTIPASQKPVRIFFSHFGISFVHSTNELFSFILADLEQNWTVYFQCSNLISPTA